MTTETNTVELATELTIAWLGNPNTRTSADDVPAFLQSMHDAVAKLSEAPVDTPSETASPEYTPAVSVRKSLASKDHIISMIDGKPYRTLRRHLAAKGLTAEDYRARYGLKRDYPMVAESYSESRRAMAKKIGLGRKPGQVMPKPEQVRPEPEQVTPKPAEAAPAKKARKPKVAAPSSAE